MQLGLHFRHTKAYMINSQHTHKHTHNHTHTSWLDAYPHPTFVEMNINSYKPKQMIHSASENPNGPESSTIALRCAKPPYYIPFKLLVKSSRRQATITLPANVHNGPSSWCSELYIIFGIFFPQVIKDPFSIIIISIQQQELLGPEIFCRSENDLELYMSNWRSGWSRNDPEEGMQRWFNCRSWDLKSF